DRRFPVDRFPPWPPLTPALSPQARRRDRQALARLPPAVVCRTLVLICGEAEGCRRAAAEVPYPGPRMAVRCDQRPPGTPGATRPTPCLLREIWPPARHSGCCTKGAPCVACSTRTAVECHVRRGLARAVGAAEAGSAGQGWRG